MYNGTNANLTDSNNLTGAVNNQTYLNSTVIASSVAVNGTVTSINQTMQSQQIQVATQNILHSVGKSLSKFTDGIYSRLDYWWNGARPKVSVKIKQKIIAAKVDLKRLDLQKQARFESIIYSTVKDMLDKRITIDHGLNRIVKHLNFQSSGSLDEDFDWVVQVLKENFPEQDRDIENSLHRKQIALALDQLKKNWIEATLSEAVDKIISYLESDSSGDPVQAFDLMIMILRKSFDEIKSKELESALIDKLKETNAKNIKQKREVQENQTVYALSPKVAINATWDRLSLCANKLRAVLFGATNTTQEVKILDVQANVLQINQTLSAAISAQFPPRLGSNYVSSGCGDNGIFHLSTADDQQVPAPPFYHAAIEGDRLAVPQHPSAFLSTDLLGKAPRPAHIGGYRSARPYPLSNPGYNITTLYGYDTNSSGVFPSLPPTGVSVPFSTINANGIVWQSNRMYQEIFTFAGGLVKSLVKMSFGIQELSFNQTLGLTGVTNTTNSNPGIFNQIDEIPITTRIPLADNTQFTTLISQLVNGSTASYTYDISTKTFTSAALLPDGSRAFVPNADMNIAHCPDQPGIYVYMREVQGALKYDVVNATMGSTSIIGGEQEYTDYNTSSRPRPGVGCLSNGKIIFSFLDNGSPSYVTLDLNPPVAVPVSAPLTSPPSFSPLGAAPNFPPATGVEIVVNIPPNLGDKPVPIDGNGIVVSNATVIMTITDKHGFKIVFTNNGTDVKEGQYFPVTIFKDGTLSWGRGTAVDGSVPEFTGCNADDQCTTSTPGTPLQVLVGSGLDWRIILGAAAAAVGAVGVAGTVFYCRIFKPRYDQRRKREKESAAAARAASLEMSSSSSSTEQAHPMMQWTQVSPSYNSTDVTVNIN